MTDKNTFLIFALGGAGVLILANRKKFPVDGSIVARLSEAIARQEGFYVAGSVPARLHNPGDLTVDTISRAIGKEGIYVKYANDADGWAALQRQVEMMFTGESHVYNREMSIWEVAQRYTSTEVDYWANNVASFLGVTADTKLSELV